MRLRLLYFIVFHFLLFPCFTSPLKAQVIANFTASKTSGCAPLSVNFNNTSTGSTSYLWNFGNGNTSALTSPGATYNTPGVYSVVLTASNGASSNTHTVSISVYANPIPNFSTSAMPSCVGQQVTFTDNSIAGSGVISKWDWDFGDGTNLSTNTITTTHAYANAGIFPVTLIVTNSNGCSKSIINNVTVNSAPHANFTGTPTNACHPPTPVNFTNTSTFTGAVTYLWNFGDGNTSTLANPTNVYNFTGTYPISLEITQQGCKDTMIKPNYVVIEDIVPDFNSDRQSVCEGQTVAFTDQSTPLSITRTWDFGDGVTSTLANPTHTYVTAGTYTVSLLNASAIGCSHSLVKNDYITVLPNPIVSFSANKTSSCIAPFSVNFTDNSVNGTSWNWDFGDGSTSTLKSPTHVYNKTGSYNVTLVVTSANGCKTTLAKNKYIFISAPTADFNADTLQGCIPLSSNFTSTSTSPFDAITKYTWDFGNGTATSIIPNIHHTYPAIGSYTIKLIITTALGCTDTIIKGNYIKAGTPPTANFSVVKPAVCHGVEAEFTDLSIGADSAHWEFDANQGTFDTPWGATLPFNPVLQSFPDTGTFFVRQIAYNHGCPDTFQINNAIRIMPPKPILSFTLNCLTPNTVAFTDASQGADSIVWDFLDGSPKLSNVPAPTHTYVNVGPHGVQLTAFNFATGCSETITQVFKIANPKATLTDTPNKGCYPLPVHFTNLSLDADTVTWSFGDGTPNSHDTTNFFHTFSLPGKYPVKLIITDVNGCIDSTKTDIIVYGPLPNFAGNILTGCTALPVTFTDATLSDSTIVQWDWNFGDGTPIQTTASATINHTYNVTGLYSVTMTVTDKNGCVNSSIKTDYIEPTFPIPAFVADTFACKKQGVFFDASATNVAFPATFNWNFGDGTTDIGTSLTHFYTSDSLYNVNLTVTDKNGCTSSLQHSARIQSPVAAFTYSVISQACGVSNIQFTDQSKGLSINSWKWNFGDLASSPQQNPIHVYTKPGLFPVTLEVTNVAGCTDTFLIDSLLVLGPVGTFSFTPDRGCIPLEVTFTAVSSNSTNYNWDFGDGTIVNTINPVIKHTYTQVDTATPFLLLGNVLPDGSPCQFPAPPAGFIIATTVVSPMLDSILHVPCNGDSIGSIFTSTSGGTVPYTYSWSTTPIQTISTATNLPAGTYTLTVTDSNSCVSPLVAIITQPNPVITTAGVNDTVCPGTPAVLKASASGGSGNYTFSWQPGGILNAGTLNITPITDTVYTVIAIDKNNCLGKSVTTKAIVYALPPDSVIVNATALICPGQSSDISVQTFGPTGTLNYSWNHGLGNTPGVFRVTPAVPSTYVVNVSNSCGASISASANVGFYAPPTMVVSSDTTAICAPEAIQFNDHSISSNPLDTVSIWDWDFGDGSAHSALQHPSHVYSQPGAYSVNLIVTTANGCTNNNAGASMVINANPYPIANFSINSTELELPYDIAKTRNQSFGASSYHWDFGDGSSSTLFNPSHLYNSVGSFRIQLISTSAKGCSDTSYIDLTTSADVVFPNAFTPNPKFASDGIYDMNNLDNDIFFPFTSGVTEYKFEIFDRWGELVFESLDIKIGWNGYYKGKICQQDVYVWKAYIKHNNGKVFNKSGDVTLLR
jgi:gliding motility-associated-like protein